MYAIAAVSRNGIIGSGGKIPWHLPLDFRWFKHKTLGGILFMGRKTYEGIGKPLPGRTTYLISRQAHIDNLPPEVVICNDWKGEVMSLEYTEKAIWVCGGAEIYKELLPHCSRLYLTRVKQDMSGDAHFPELPESFYCDQLIHENDAFLVERWLNSSVSSGILTPKEEWPFSAAGTVPKS